MSGWQKQYTRKRIPLKPHKKRKRKFVLPIPKLKIANKANGYVCKSLINGGEPFPND